MLAPFLLTASETQKADLIVLGAKIWTGDPERPEAQAMALGAGRVLAVGSASEVDTFRGPGTRVLEARGRRVVPGFIDCHTHFLESGSDLLAVDLRDSSSPEEFARRLGRYASTRPPGSWISGGNWDEQRWPQARLPDRGLLDPVTGDHPACLARIDGHEVVCNSLAIRLAGVTRETPSPPGGVIVRDGRGEPTGVFKDAAVELVEAKRPPATEAEKEAALRAALAEAGRVGVTSIQDITVWEDVPTYRASRERGELTVRVSSRLPLPDWQRASDLRRSETQDEFWRIDGVKGFMDGSLGSSTALMFEPFSDEPGNRGTFAGEWYPEGVMLERIVGADRAGLQVEVHAIGDRANAILLDLYEETEKQNGQRDRRFRVEHAQHLRRQDIPRFARLSVLASVQPYHAIDDGRWAEKRLGPERSRTTYAFRSLLDSGATLLFGSDWDVAPLSPILGIYAAVTRRTLDGKHPGGWVPQQKITVGEALRAYTTAAAYGEFSERQKGKLAPGYLGDFVVLSRDILTIPPDEIEGVQVDATVVGGKIVYERAGRP
jgi:predicted amidohydrolase YtcJ